MEIEKVLPIESIEEIKSLIDKGLLSDYELREVMRYLQAIESYEENHPIECYKPIEKTRSGGPYQLAFHQSLHKGRGMFMANQTGKTKAGSMEVSFHFTNIYPDYYPKEGRLPPINNGRIVVKDFPKMVGEVIEPALLKAIPPMFIKDVKRNSKGFLTKMISTSGAWFDIVTHDMDDESFEGWQGDWAWFDEPPPRSKFIATTRGLMRRQGRWWITATPLTQAWMYDEIYCNPKYFCITVDIRDNPYLKEEEIEEFESQLTEDEKEARLHGRFIHLSGLTYKEFDTKVHVKPRGTFIPPDWPRWMIVDPHMHRPFAMIWGACDPMDRLWVYDEWPSEWFHEIKSCNKSLKDYYHIIQEKEMGQRIYKRIIDGRACKAPQLGEEESETLLDMLDKLGFTPPFEPSYITKTTGIADPGHLKVKEYLRISPVTNQPSLFVLENCKNVIYSFQHNTWDERPNPLVPSEKQSQYAKDFLDLLRYWLMDDPHWVDLSSWMSHHEIRSQPKWVERNLLQADLPYSFGSLQDW